MTFPTIVIPAYNRPAALLRLLNSLNQAWYPEHAIGLEIVIDAGGTNQRDVVTVATQFDWQHGRKTIVQHAQPQGLVGNIYFCGGITQRDGAIVLLEDDLVVSRAFYHYTLSALDKYRASPHIGGISLNALQFNGFTHQAFTPYLDASDTYFMQVAWFQGQIYTAKQWQAYQDWLRERNRLQDTLKTMHPYFSQFPDTDWFPLKTAWLVDTQRYYVFPRQSLTTNFGDQGTHFKTQTNRFQVPLQHSLVRYRMQDYQSSGAVYDSWQEMTADCFATHAPQFNPDTITIDLNGTKPLAQIQTPQLLSNKSCKYPQRSYANIMQPLEENVFSEAIGRSLHLGDTPHFRNNKAKQTGRLARQAKRLINLNK